jgi:hypothetical protein
MGAALAACAWTGAAAAQDAPPPSADSVLPAEEGFGDTIAATPEPPPPEPAPPPPSAGTISDAIAGGKVIFEARVRYEGVDQTKTAVLRENGESFTLRTRLGWETAEWNGLKGLVEFEDVRQLGSEDFQVQVPGAATPPLNGANKVRFPIINDPEVTELNRLQLTWTPSSLFQAVVGRQRILLEDQRFVGNVGWRQDEQTFDAARADVTYGRWKASYAYVGQVNRILGEERDWDSDSHLLNVSYALGDPLRLLGFVYALDFGNSPANNSITYGGKVSGKTWLNLFQVAYNATYANQQEYRGGTPPFELDYWSADVAGTFDIWTAKLTYEVLEGTGTRGFTTPLATTHAFNGWADAWVSPGGNKSFADGLEDLNVQLVARPRWKRTYLYNLEFTARFHDFDDQRTGADLAYEVDLQVSAAITPKLTALIKYADFNRETTVPVGTLAPPPSRTKVWFQLEYRL